MYNLTPFNLKPHQFWDWSGHKLLAESTWVQYNNGTFGIYERGYPWETIDKYERLHLRNSPEWVFINDSYNAYKRYLLIYYVDMGLNIESFL